MLNEAGIQLAVFGLSRPAGEKYPPPGGVSAKLTTGR
jgi:hypothetical protein